ncbi:hypothetical protein COCNU_04G009060 [Cocos nucifera]|uniref:Uncharacterized protein n=1 Tax=Cocos nucifera TaxID=13894 RepID=A0A8K0N008_COCNU|nr:hypothetical protein COCNU_04G009060 [Cocos nucifera]
MARVQKKMNVVEERALEVDRVEKKAQVILIEVGLEVGSLKEVLKQLEEKLEATKAKVGKVEVEVVKLPWKAMESFQASKEFMDEKAEFIVESYMVGIWECRAKIVGHYPKLDLFFSSNNDDDDVQLNLLSDATLEEY